MAQNLVPNPSFEQVNIPSLSCGFYLPPSDFNKAMIAWINPTLGNPDILSVYLDTICPMYPYKKSSFVSGPGWQTPRNGNNMVGLFSYLNQIESSREYVQVKLISPMQKGKSYKVSFYASLGKCSSFACNLGAYFSVRTVGSDLSSSNLPVIPQVVSKEIISNNVDWVLIEQVIKATNSWQFITIGNFFNNVNTKTISIKPLQINPYFAQNYAYYFIDDVSIVPNCLSVSIDTAICSGTSVVLTASGANFIGWADSSKPSIIISTNPSLSVSPKVSTSYLAYSQCDTLSVYVSVAQDYTSNFLVGNTSSCVGDSVLLSGVIPHGSPTFLWQNGSTLPYQYVKSSGTYVLHALVSGCYSHVDSIKVVFNPYPFIQLPPDTGFCTNIGQTLTLNAAFPGASYKWYSSNSFFTIATTPSIVVKYKGKYTVLVSQSNGCSRTFQTNVKTYSILPNVDLGSNKELCYGKSLTLNALPVNSHQIDSLKYNILYQWQDGSSNSTCTVTSPGTYWVKVSDGCTIVDSVNVTYSPQILNIGHDTSLCTGQTLLLNASYPGATYIWQDNSTAPTFLVTGQGSYTVNARLNNCQYTQSIQVSFVQAPSIGIGPILGIGPDQTLLMNASCSNCKYIWQDGSMDSTFLVTQEGKYWVTVTNWLGCNNTDTINVYMIDLQMPNVFSPNGDGKNDLYIPIIKKGIPTAQINIINRWGDTIFHSDNLVSGWDGTVLGKDAPQGVYFWLVNYSDATGAIGERKGVFSLER